MAAPLPPAPYGAAHLSGPLISNGLAAFTFWGWQLIIVLAAVTLPLGITSAKYAELEWPIDILIAIVWVAYAIVFLAPLPGRKVRHIMLPTGFLAPLLSLWLCFI